MLHVLYGPFVSCRHYFTDIFFEPLGCFRHLLAEAYGQMTFVMVPSDIAKTRSILILWA